MASSVEHGYQVMVVGAGPVGLLTALRMGQRGIKTIVIEKHRELLPTTRAMVYQPVVLERLRDFGILDTVESIAYLNKDGIFWRTKEGEQLGHLPMLENEHVLLLGQQRMSELLLNEIQKYPEVDVRFNTSFAGCVQQDGARHVQVMVHESSLSREEDDTYEVEWLVAADGSNSGVRRSLCIPFEGFSFTEFNMIGADVYYDYAKHEYGTLMNFVVDPEDAAVVIYTGQQKDLKPVGEAPPLWRVAYLESSRLSSNKEDVLERARVRCGRYARDRQDLEISRVEPYRLQQRCAAEACKGRVILIGDALHSNNPIGGMGLTTGICDAAAVSNALARVCKGEAPDSLLAEAANDRRRTWLETTNVMSQTNLQRLRGTDDASETERQAFFQGLKSNPDLPAKIRGALEKVGGRSFAATEEFTLSLNPKRDT